MVSKIWQEFPKIQQFFSNLHFFNSENSPKNCCHNVKIHTQKNKMLAITLMNLPTCLLPTIHGIDS
jgi:hypothetical protein